VTVLETNLKGFRYADLSLALALTLSPGFPGVTVTPVTWSDVRGGLSPSRKLVRSRARDSQRDMALRFALGVGCYLLALFITICALCRFAPDHMAFAFLGCAHVLNDLHRHIYYKFIVLSLVIPALLLVELASTGWTDSSLSRLMVWRTPSAMSDLSCFLLDQTPIMTGLNFVASLGVLVFSAACMHDLLRRLTGLDPNLAWAPAPAQFAIYFAVYSFFDYWGHRIDHSRVFWPLHRFHHAMDEFCIVGSVRVHPAAFTRLFQQAVPAALVGASPDMIMSLNFVMVVYHFAIHSRINSNFGWIGRYLLQSPTHHRLHHSLEAGADSGHFGVVPLWDHLFGTWRGEADHALVIGVDTPYRHGPWLIHDMWRDYREFWAELVALVLRRRAPGKKALPSAIAEPAA